ncbi:YceI family protein [Streptomyces antimicrobicus]|uniref:YceI family protein n=1 Tax=Streptomyces antimicrobicus TaxID=2883108 RepID=A0ABS8B0Q6_9ACTN|nr:YceI family protein [Streptomyces antimicrobicus]MCB5178179.1 YceI family protein [Streptomyces antimicrobicus]
MFGRRRGLDTAGNSSPGSAATLTLPPTAKLLSCRVLDTVHQPVRQARFEVTDPIGRRVVGGETDPYGGFTAAVPEGEYRLTVIAEGYAPFHGATLVGGSAQPGTAEIVLDPVEPPLLPQPGHWEIDPAHSTIAFTARHIGLARIHGRFNTFAGAVRIAERMEDSSMHVIIDTASIDTGLRMRDDHLRSADFLDAARHPTVEFYSERFIHRRGSRWTVAGALTLHGVSRSVTLDTEYLGTGTGMEGEPRAACRASAELQREDFTLNWQSMLAHGIAAIGSSVEVALDVQIVHKA